MSVGTNIESFPEEILSLNDPDKCIPLTESPVLEDIRGINSNNSVATTSRTCGIHPKMSQGNSEFVPGHSFEHVIVKQEPNTDFDPEVKDPPPLNEFEHVTVKQEPIDLDPLNNDCMTLQEFEHVEVKQESLDASSIPSSDAMQVNESLHHDQFEHISVKHESDGNLEFIETENFEITHDEENAPKTSDFNSIFLTKDHKNVHDHTYKYHMKSNGNVEETPMILCSMLLEYLDQENIGSPHLCEICNEDFISRTYINKHFNIRHPRFKGSIVIRCKVCKKCHRDIGLMENHLKENHLPYWNRRVEQNVSYQCLDCEKWSSNCVVCMSGKVTHRLNFENIDVTRVMTPGKCFTFSYDIRNEEEEAPVTLSPQYSCILCCTDDVTFEKELELNLHLKNHHIEFAFRICHICGTECCNVMDYYEHLRYCQHETCDDCEMLFDQHQNPSDFESNLYDPSCKDKACSEPFVNECSLKLHLATQHDRALLDFRISDNVFQCPVCKVVFKNEKLFYAHCVPYSMLDTFCALCSLLFHNKNERDVHAYQKHGVIVQNSLCKICDMQTNENSTSLDSHIMKEHNVELIHCNQCFSNVRIKPVHTMRHIAECYSQQSLTCSLCGYICEDSDFLTNHINLEILYTEYYKFQCKYCYNFFCSALNLCSHLLNTKCKFCGLHLCGSKKLAAHIESEHSDAI